VPEVDREPGPAHESLQSICDLEPSALWRVAPATSTSVVAAGNACSIAMEPARNRKDHGCRGCGRHSPQRGRFQVTDRLERIHEQAGLTIYFGHAPLRARPLAVVGNPPRGPLPIDAERHPGFIEN